MNTGYLCACLKKISYKLEPSARLLKSYLLCEETFKPYLQPMHTKFKYMATIDIDVDICIAGA